MRRLACFSLIAVVVFAPVRAALCQAAPGGAAPQSRWEVDRYVYDASLQRDWEVLVDCDHPDAPARMELAPKGARTPGKSAACGADAAQSSKKPAGRQRSPQSERLARDSQPPIVLKAGAAVEVTSPPNAPAQILLAGVAMQTALLGQPIRVRLSASGRFIRGIVRGPHSVELVAVERLSWSWRKP